MIIKGERVLVGDWLYVTVVERSISGSRITDAYGYVESIGPEYNIKVGKTIIDRRDIYKVQQFRKLASVGGGKIEIKC